MVRLLRKVSMYGGVDTTGAPLQVGWQGCNALAVLQDLSSTFFLPDVYACNNMHRDKSSC